MAILLQSSLNEIVLLRRTFAHNQMVASKFTQRHLVLSKFRST